MIERAAVGDAPPCRTDFWNRESASVASLAHNVPLETVMRTGWTGRRHRKTASGWLWARTHRSESSVRILDNVTEHQVETGSFLEASRPPESHTGPGDFGDLLRGPKGYSLHGALLFVRNKAQTLLIVSKSWRGGRHWAAARPASIGPSSHVAGML